MDIDLFRDLERLRQTGNFSHAASLANVSQPAFSRRIKGLEAWVGAILVDRSRQPVRLTPAGQQVLEAGLDALTLIENARSQVREAQALPDKYVVTFGAQHSIGWRFYPAWLQALEQSYGPFLSRLRADDLPSGLQDLRSGDVDFVLAYHGGHTPDDQSFETVVIGEDRLTPVCAPNDRGAPRFDPATSDRPVPHLGFGEGAPMANLLRPLFAASHLQARLSTVYENSMVGALRIRARAGDGVAWLPRSLVGPDLDSGALVQTGDPTWEIDLEIRLYRNPNRSNRLTRGIWAFLAVKQGEHLFHMK